MIHFILQELKYFKEAFRYTSTFLWFCAAVIGFILAKDCLGGVSPLVRGLGLNAPAYEGLLRFFNSNAIDVDLLQRQIFKWICDRFKSQIFHINGRVVLVLDAKKKSKEGKKMPAVKIHHQSSSSNSKAEFISAHSVECLGILVKNIGSAVSCLIFSVTFIDGFKRHNLDKTTLKDRAGEMIKSYEWIGASIIVADAWYAARQVVNAAKETGQTLITRLGKTAVGSYDPPERRKGQRGRPPKYGKSVKLLSLFGILEMLEGEVKKCNGDIITVTYWSIELMWKPIKKKVLFVGSCNGVGRIVLMSTDLTMDPLDCIQAYQYRSSIEHSFWMSVQMLFNWRYRFWSKLDLTSHKLKGNFNLHFCSAEKRQVYWAKIESYRLYLTIGFLVHAILILVGIKFGDMIVNKNILFFRSSNRNAVTSIPIIRAAVDREYLKFLSSTSETTDSGKFIRDLHKKNQIRSQAA